MNFRLFGCGKFKFLAIEKFDRQLTPRELDFYRKHREVCFCCMRYEQQGTNAMNLLSAAAISEPEISENFDERVLQLLHKQPKRVAITYWTPALAGAAVAGIAIVATMQLIATSPIKFFDGTRIQPDALRYNDKESDRIATSPNLVLPRELSKS